MPLAYHVITIDGVLPPTKTLPRPGQRLFWVKAPGVVLFDAKGQAVKTCMFDAEILQEKGRKTDHEGYHVEQLKPLDIRNLPRDRFGRPALCGYLFECFTSEPTAERPGIYRVACGADGRAYWCECLGAKGWHQDSQCKHRDLTTALAERAPVPRPALPENASER